MPDFPLAKFRILYPQFETADDETVLALAEEALCYVSIRCVCGRSLWMLLVAHMLQLMFDAEDGAVAVGAVTSASISSVSVSIAAPTSKSAWGHWLNLTPWGQQFQALFRRCNSGGRYAGPFPERAAFRNVGGRFPLRGRV